MNAFTKLREHAVKIGSGSTPRGGQRSYKRAGIPLIRSQNVLNNSLSLSNVVYIDDGQHQSMTNSCVVNGDVLLNITGASIGRACVYKKCFESNVNQHVCIIRTKDTVDPNFLSLYLNSHLGQKQIFSFQSGGSREGLNFNQIGNILIPNLDTGKQVTISNTLRTWDTAIKKTEALIAAKEKQFDWLIRNLIGKQFNNPNWSKATLEQSGYYYTGLSGKSKKDFGHGKAYLPYLNIFNNSRINKDHLDYVSIDPNEKQNLVRVGDVFFTTSSETPNEVGTSSVLLDDIGECYLNSFCFAWRITSSDLSPSFLQHYFRSAAFRHQVAILTQGVTRYNISKKQMMKTTIAYPSLTEQNAIANTLDGINREIALLKKIGCLHHRQKTGLMQKLLTEEQKEIISA